MNEETTNVKITSSENSEAVEKSGGDAATALADVAKEAIEETASRTEALVHAETELNRLTLELHTLRQAYDEKMQAHEMTFGELNSKTDKIIELTEKIVALELRLDELESEPEESTSIQDVAAAEALEQTPEQIEAEHHTRETEQPTVRARGFIRI